MSLPCASNQAGASCAGVRNSIRHRNRPLPLAAQARADGPRRFDQGPDRYCHLIADLPSIGRADPNALLQLSSRSQVFCRYQL